MHFSRDSKVSYLLIYYYNSWLGFFQAFFSVFTWVCITDPRGEYFYETTSTIIFNCRPSDIFLMGSQEKNSLFFLAPLFFQKSNPHTYVKQRWLYYGYSASWPWRTFFASAAAERIKLSQHCHTAAKLPKSPIWGLGPKKWGLPQCELNTGTKILSLSKKSHFENVIFWQNSHFQNLIFHKIHKEFLDKKWVFAPV